MNAKAVKLSSEIITEAEKYGFVFSRSIPKQIEHWAKIGKIAEENPDLSYDMIKNILLSKKEMRSEKLSEYKFG